MNDKQDRDIVIEIADNMLYKYKHVFSMSSDKGHWLADNKALLKLEIPLLLYLRFHGNMRLHSVFFL